MQPEYAFKKEYASGRTSEYRPLGEVQTGVSKTTRVPERRLPFANLSEGLCISLRAGSSYEISFDSFLRQLDIER